jgi:hypothetical protein
VIQAAKSSFFLGRQSRLDEDILGGSQIGLRIFAKAKLQPMLFVSGFELIPQMIPSLCIMQLESLDTKTLRVGNNSSKYPNGPAHDQTRNRGAACSASFMPANGAKALFQGIIGRRHIRDIIGVEQTRSIVGSDFAEDLDHISQNCDVVLMILHRAYVCLQLLLHPGSIKVVMVLQDGGGLVKPLPSHAQSRPDSLRLGESGGEPQLDLG